MATWKIIATALATSALIGMPAATADPHDPCEEVPINVGDALYVVIDSIFEDDYILHFAVFAESNGEPGLQRGGLSLFGNADPCQAYANPDTLLYSSYEEI